MLTKKINIVIAFIFLLSSLSAQTADKSRLVIAAFVPQQIVGMPASARANLENKLNQILTANGMAGNAKNTRFIISANVTVVSKDITPSAPPMIAYTLDITFYLGDGLEGKAFSSYSTTVKGVGENETKAYMAALKTIKTTDPGYQSFIEQGKAKIIAYYNAQCDMIIADAKKMASMNKYDEAIWKLSSVPDACTDCWNKCNIAIAPIFKQKIDFECKTKLNEASTLWNANQSWDGAQQAGTILASINPSAACFGEAKALQAAIAKRILEVDKREWALTWEKEVGLEKDQIKAARDIGVAWGNGQPQNVTYVSLW